MTWPHHFQGQFVVHRPQWDNMINLSTKFDVSTFTHYEDMKSNAKYRNWGGFGSQGSTKVIGIISIWYSAFHFLFNFNRIYASILYCFRVIMSYLWKAANFNIPNTCIWGSTGSDLELLQDLWHHKTRVLGLSRGVICMILSLAILIQYRHGQTDLNDSIYCTSIASRGKMDIKQ